MSQTLLSRTVRIANKRGLHARASAKFVTLASGLKATVRVHKVGHADNEVVGTSIMGLMMLAAGIGTIMLDNFSLDDLRRGVELVGGRATIEASGGVTLDTVRAIAETGVDVISVGALTHSAGALDLGLDLRIEA